MLEGQAGPQHHGRGRDRETREAICGGLEKVSARDRVTSGHLARVITASGRRTPRTVRKGFSGFGRKLINPSSDHTNKLRPFWGWEATCTLVKVCAAAGAVESVRRVKGLGPTARRHGRAARSDGYPPSSREPADLWPAWRMVWHVGGDGHGADRSGPPLCCRRRAMNSDTELDSGRTSYSHERHRPSKILVYEGSRLLTESI